VLHQVFYKGKGPGRETDYDGRVSKCGDALLRTVLYEAAHSLMIQSRKWSWLKAWGMRVAQRRGIRRAIVAVASFTGGDITIGITFTPPGSFRGTWSEWSGLLRRDSATASFAGWQALGAP
jgi:hypothetical protein